MFKNGAIYYHEPENEICLINNIDFDCIGFVDYTYESDYCDDFIHFPMDELIKDMARDLENGKLIYVGEL